MCSLGCTGGAGTGKCCTKGCCDTKYVQITDYMLFVSICPTGCLNCTSATACIICDISLGYYINRADQTCYLTCPQTTYKDKITTFLSSTVIEYQCSSCPTKCL